MKVIIGLGNPEPEFSGTRHNVGKEVLNIYADKIGESWEFNKKVNAWIIKKSDYVLAKPSEYMNDVGHAVRKLIDYFDLNLGDILIIYDELDMIAGEYKISPSGSKIHNGLLSIAQCLGDKSVDRGNLFLKVGVREASIESSVQKKGRTPSK